MRNITQCLSTMSLHNLLLVFCVLMSDATASSQIYRDESYCLSKGGQDNCQELEAMQKFSNAGEELRILLVGKTGVGKSASGNTILQRQAFKSDFSSSSVTAVCEKAYGVVNGRKVSVIDSPGLFDTGLTEADVVNRIKQCIPFSAPGLHVFLVVIQLGRFTEEEEKTVNLFQEIFGKDSYNYTMALFTHGDKLKGKSIHQFIRDNQKLLNFIKKCRGRYHVFNNEDENPNQVTQLLESIDKIVTGNGGEYYTTKMLQETERAVEEEKRRILKANEAQRQKELEALKEKYYGEALTTARKEMEEEHNRKARRQAEEEPSIFGRILNGIVRIISHFFSIFD